MATWVELDSGDIASGLGAPYTLFEDLRDRDDANAEKPLQVYFSEKTVASTAPTWGDAGVSKPFALAGDAKKLVIVAECKVAGGDTGEARFYLDNGASQIYSDEPSFTNSGYVDKTFTFSDVSSMAGTEPDLKLEARSSSGNNVNIQSVDRGDAYSSRD